MKSQDLHTVWCNISGETAGEIWDWSLAGVKGLNKIGQLNATLEDPRLRSHAQSFFLSTTGQGPWRDVALCATCRRFRRQARTCRPMPWCCGSSAERPHSTVTWRLWSIATRSTTQLSTESNENMSDRHQRSCAKEWARTQEGWVKPGRTGADRKPILSTQPIMEDQGIFHVKERVCSSATASRVSKEFVPLPKYPPGFLVGEVKTNKQQTSIMLLSYRRMFAESKRKLRKTVSKLTFRSLAVFAVVSDPDFQQRHNVSLGLVLRQTKVLRNGHPVPTEKQWEKPLWSSGDALGSPLIGWNVSRPTPLQSLTD